MSPVVSLPPAATPRFPDVCVCCMAPQAERRPVTWIVAISRRQLTLPIPYCREHAELHDAWAAYQKASDAFGHDAPLYRYSPMTLARYALVAGLPLAAIGIPVAIAAGGEPLFGGVVGLLIGAGAGMVALRRRMAGERHASVPHRPALPVAADGTRIKWHGRALGFELTSEVTGTELTTERQGPLVKTTVREELQGLGFTFDHPGFARRFEAVN